MLKCRISKIFAVPRVVYKGVKNNISLFNQNLLNQTKKCKIKIILAPNLIKEIIHHSYSTQLILSQMLFIYVFILDMWYYYTHNTQDVFSVRYSSAKKFVIIKNIIKFLT